MADGALIAVGAVGAVGSVVISYFAWQKKLAQDDPMNALERNSVQMLERKRDIKDNDALGGWMINNKRVTVFEEIGRGHIGVVYRADISGQAAAVKAVFQKDISAKDMRYIQNLKRLIHPNLVQCLGICPNYSNRPKKRSAVLSGSTNDMKGAEEDKKSNAPVLDHEFIIIYEYMETGPLFHALHNKSRRFSWKTRVKIAREVATAMDLLHTQKTPVIHGNLSSVNVLLDEDLVAKVSDFGMRAIMQGGSEIQNPLWTAPEILSGKKSKLTPEADVYAFGVILWELMTRQVPYVSSIDFKKKEMNVKFQQIDRVKKGERPAIPGGLPAVARELIERCWHQDPRKRPKFSEIARVLTDNFPASVDMTAWDAIEVKIDKRRASTESIDIVIPEQKDWMIDAEEIELERGVKVLGQGSFGKVIRTMWKGTPVAAKYIDMYAQVTRDQAAAFINELSVLCALRHKNIVLFQGAILSHEKYMCIIEELCEKGSLWSVLKDKTEALDYNRQLQILLSVAEAMCYLHEGFNKDKPVIHCDLRSANILVTKNWEVKVCDFGLASMLQNTVVDGDVGNPFWTAPEVMAGSQYSKASDVYSFGIVAWEVFARKQPFKGYNPHQAILAILTENARPTVPDFVPDPMAKLIKDCWQADAKSRPTFPQIVERLREIRAEGLPRLHLTLENAKLYRKKTLVYAFRSKDRFTFHKSWGRSVSNYDDYVVIGPRGDAYTCAADRFKTTYVQAGSEPHVYRKKTRIFARKMDADFLLQTLEGLEKGDAGSYLAQNPTKNEQWPIDAKTFQEMYEICPDQTLRADEKPERRPDEKKGKRGGPSVSFADEKRPSTAEI